MNQWIKTLSVVGILAVTGCANLEQAVQKAQEVAQQAAKTAQAKPVAVQEPIKESLSKICQDTKENPLRAKDNYSRKFISVFGNVQSIGQRPTAFGTHHNIMIKTNDNITVFFETNNSSDVKNLSIGKMASFVGMFKYSSHDYGECTVSIIDGNTPSSRI